VLQSQAFPGAPVVQRRFRFKTIASSPPSDPPTRCLARCECPLSRHLRLQESNDDERPDEQIHLNLICNAGQFNETTYTSSGVESNRQRCWGGGGRDCLSRFQGNHSSASRRKALALQRDFRDWSVLVMVCQSNITGSSLRRAAPYLPNLFAINTFFLDVLAAWCPSTLLERVERVKLHKVKNLKPCQSYEM